MGMGHILYHWISEYRLNANKENLKSHQLKKTRFFLRSNKEWNKTQYEVMTYFFCESRRTFEKEEEEKKLYSTQKPVRLATVVPESHEV